MTREQYDSELAIEADEVEANRLDTPTLAPVPVTPQRLTNAEVGQVMAALFPPYEEFVLRLAEDRGVRNCTGAAVDELQVPGYTAAWRRGRLRALLAEAAAVLRAPGGTAEERQHRANLALYALLEAQRLMEVV